MSKKRSDAFRLVIFNHKGGVGKTTLTMNLAAELARRGKRVLLVDSDPQCNLTSYLVAAEVVDDLLDESDTDEGKTVWSAVKPISEATGSVRVVEPLEAGHPNLFLIPGDIRLSEFETDLAEFWAQCLQRKVRGFRGTTALSTLVNAVSKDIKADFVFYDAGPNIGPLNRIILLDCDYFIIPVACDLFSLRALKTLGRTLVSWIEEWQTIGDLAPEDIYLLPGQPKLLGYVPEGFRVYGGRVASQHSTFLSRIDRDIHSQVIALLRKIDPSLAVGRQSDFKLGEIKNFESLVPASQEQGVAIPDANAGTPEQRQTARVAFSNLADRFLKRIQGYDANGS